MWWDPGGAFDGVKAGIERGDWDLKGRRMWGRLGDEEG